MSITPDRVPDNRGDWFRDEIMTHDETLTLMRRRYTELAQWFSDGAIDPMSEEARKLSERLEKDWPYNGQPVGYTGKLRPFDTGSGYDMDGSGPFEIVEEQMVLSGRPEVVPISDGEWRAVYTFDGHGADAGRRQYAFDDDIFRLTFCDLAPASVAWQLEHLVPEMMQYIRETIPADGTLTERLQSLGGLQLRVNIEEFGDYSLLEHLAKYIDTRVKIDHRVMHNLKITGEMTLETTDDDGRRVPSMSILDDSLSLAGYFAPIVLATRNDGGDVTYIPRISVFIHSDRPMDEDDDELGLWPEGIISAESVRPRAGQSLARMVMKHAETLGLLVSETEEFELAETSDEEVAYVRRTQTHTERTRYLQALLDACIKLVRPVAERRYDTEEAAHEAAVTVKETVEELLGKDLEEMSLHCFVADGTGLLLPKFDYFGHIIDVESGDPTGSLAFIPDAEVPAVENSDMRRYMVRLNGAVWPTITQVVHEDESVDGYYQANVRLGARVENGGSAYSLAIPGTRQVAMSARVDHYIYIPLDGSATLENIDVFDMRRFEETMRRFSARLETMPDLLPSYRALLNLQRALFHERADSEFTSLQKIHFLQTLGLQGGGDTDASTMIVDALADLLGLQRIISVGGEMYKQNNPHEVFEGIVAGILGNVVSLQPGGTTEEPMLHVIPLGVDAQPVYVPLATIREFSF